MAERVKNRISQEDRERLIRPLEAPDQDYFVVADNLDINRSTARGIIGRYLRENRVGERPRGGGNHVKVDEEMGRCLEAILNENCTLTLTAINAELPRRLPDKPYVSDRTISKHLEGMLFTLKLSHRVPAERNRQDVVERRHEYAHWFLEEANLHHTVFIDECGYSIWTARSQGRSRRGDRAYRQICDQKGRNITICLAISPVLGVVHHVIQMGGMTREIFAEFLNNTAEHLNDEETHYLVYDGAPAHRGAADPTDDIHVKCSLLIARS